MQSKLDLVHISDVLDVTCCAWIVSGFHSVQTNKASTFNIYKSSILI